MLLATLIMFLIIMILITYIRKEIIVFSNKGIGNASQILAIPLFYIVAKIILKQANNSVMSINQILRIQSFKILKFYGLGISLCLLILALSLLIGFVLKVTYFLNIDLDYSVLMTLLIMLFIGFSEELFFRGIVQQLLSVIFKNQIASVIITSLVFSLFHTQIFVEAGGWEFFINAFVFGIFMSLVFIRYESIMPCILIHSAWNFSDTYLLEFGEIGCLIESNNNFLLNQTSTYLSIVLYSILSIVFIINLIKFPPTSLR